MNAKPYSVEEATNLAQLEPGRPGAMRVVARVDAARLLATAERAELLDEAGELLERISTAAADGEFAEANMLAPRCRAFLARVKR